MYQQQLSITRKTWAQIFIPINLWDKKKKKARVTRYRTHRWIKISELKEYKKHAQISTNWNRIYSQSCILEFYTFGRSNLLFFFLPPFFVLFRFILFYFYPRLPLRTWKPWKNIDHPLLADSSATFPPPRLSFERNENRNRISTRKSKNNRIGKGSTWPGTICFTAINDWQFAKIPRRFRPLGFTSLRDRTNARPSNGFAVRITLCVEAAAEKCNGGRQGRERELRMGGGDCALREFHRVNMKHWFIDRVGL